MASTAELKLFWKPEMEMHLLGDEMRNLIELFIIYAESVIIPACPVESFKKNLF